MSEADKINVDSIISRLLEGNNSNRSLQNLYRFIRHVYSTALANKGARGLVLVHALFIYL